MKKFFTSVENALAGIRLFILKDRNAKIEIILAAVAILLGWVTRIPAIEWLFVLLCIGLVLSLEMMNSVMERFCDMVTTGFHPKIKIIKDVAAGAVLVAALFSLIIGLVIFIPALLKLFSHIS